MGNQTEKPAEKSMTFLLDKKQRRKVQAAFSRHINRGQVHYLKAGHLDLIEVERSGVTFIDAVTGKRFLDCFSSAGSFNVGRHNPDVLTALDEALGTLDMGRFNLVSPQKVALAQKLVAIAPGDLNRVFFAAGGGDAVDGAIKLARGATGRSRIISTFKAYHGHTGFSLSANGKEHYRNYCEPLIPEFDFVPFNDFDAVEKLASEKTAAIILEPIQGEAGIFVADDEYLRALRELCDRLGILLIFDEIQTGWGRTGKLFACEHSGVVPDILCVAKSISGGLFPNAAVLYRDTQQLTRFVETVYDFHPTTTGGSDLGCATSLAVIDFIEKNRLWENAQRMGEKLRNALLQIKEENPKIIKEVRGRGLMIGIEYLHEFMGPMMSDALAKQGVFAAYSGNAPQVMRFMLPIVVTEEEMDLAIRSIRNAVKSMKPLLFFALPVAKISPVLRALNSEKVQTVLFGWIRRIGDLFTRS